MNFFHNIEFQMPLRSRRRRRSSTIRKSSKRRTISGRRLSSRRRYRATPDDLLEIKQRYLGDDTANNTELKGWFDGEEQFTAAIEPIQEDMLKKYCLLQMILAGNHLNTYLISTFTFSNLKYRAIAGPHKLLKATISYKPPYYPSGSPRKMLPIGKIKAYVQNFHEVPFGANRCLINLSFKKETTARIDAPGNMFHEQIVTLYTPPVLEAIDEAADLDGDAVAANFESAQVAGYTLVENLALTSALFDNAVLRILDVTAQRLPP